MNLLIRVAFLLMISFNVLAECTNETEGATGKGSSNGPSDTSLTMNEPGSTNPKGGGNSIDCGVLDLPPIQAVQGYVCGPSGGTGGRAGIMFALNAPTSGGSNPVIVTNTNVPSDMGCDGDYTPAERLAVANAGFQTLLVNMQWYIDNEDTTGLDAAFAQAWIFVNTWSGTTYDFQFPDGTTGEYEVGSNNNLISEEACPQIGGGD